MSNGVGIEQEPPVGWSVLDNEGFRWIRWNHGWLLVHTTRSDDPWTWEKLKDTYGPLMNGRQGP